MFMLIPIVILLTVSFFVLVTMSKVEAKGLKTFGWLICVLLWLTAALVLTTALTIMGVNPCGTQGIMSQCPIMSSQSRIDPYHPWRNDPHKGMMMDKSDEMPMGSMKCPGMQDMGMMDTGNKTREAQPAKKK